MSELKTLLVGDLVGRNLMPDIISVLNTAYKKNDSLTYTSCNFLISYINKIYIGIEFRYENLTDINILSIKKFMEENKVNQRFINESEMILKRMKFKIILT